MSTISSTATLTKIKKGNYFNSLGKIRGKDGAPGPASIASPFSIASSNRHVSTALRAATGKRERFKTLNTLKPHS